MTSRFKSTPSKGAPQYSFPLLSSEEILVCLAELQIPFSKEQLQKPTREAVRTVFEQFVEILMGVSREEFTQPVFGAVDVISYPELHEESVAALFFHRSMQKLLAAAGVPDFQMSDYARPDTPRLRRLFSAVINLAKFREERLVHFQDLSSSSDALLEHKQKLEQNNAALRAEIEAYESRLRDDQPQVDAVERDNAALASQLQELQQRQGTLQAEVRSRKSEASELGERIASLKVRILNEEQDIARCESMVVSSPERVRKEIEEQQEQLEDDREQVASMERRTRELQSRVSGLQTCEADVRKAVLVMEECKREMDECHVQQRAVRDHKQSIAVAESELRRLEYQENHLRRQVQSAEERVTRVQRQISEREADIQTTHQRLQEDRSQAEKENLMVQLRISQHEALVVQTTEKKEQLENEFRQELERASEAYRQLEHQVVKYHRRLFSSMQQARAAISTPDTASS